MGHCIEQAETAHEVFTAAVSSFSSNYTACTQPEPNNTAETGSHVELNMSLDCILWLK